MTKSQQQGTNFNACGSNKSYTNSRTASPCSGKRKSEQGSVDDKMITVKADKC